MKKSLEQILEILAQKTMADRPEVLRRMSDPEYNRQKTQAYRDRLAVTLRTARNVLKG